MHIIHIAPELSPIAKAGGLGDVIYGLSQEFKKQGHTIEIIIPKYDCIKYDFLQNMRIEIRDLISFDGPYQYKNTVWNAELDGLKVSLIDDHHPHHFFRRSTVYGCQDDIERFIYFSRVSLEYLFKSGRKPDIIHTHDWTTAIISVLYKDLYQALGYKESKIVSTIHNLQHQGKCRPHNVTQSGLRGENYLAPEKMQDPFDPSLLNLLKGGINYSDFITTVSPTYKEEIKTQEGGFGLHHLLAEHEDKLKGILNGIDADYWNPKKDPLISYNFSQDTVTEGKKSNKRALLQKLELKESRGPLVGCVCRLVDQKGPYLIKRAIEKTVSLGGQFVFIGSPSTPELENVFKSLQDLYKDLKDVSVRLTYDEELSHLLFAGADAFFMPSLFEPCGLTQMIALKYGTVPVVRATGGLKDTVFDFKYSKKQLKNRNGFVFEFPDFESVDWVLERVFDLYLNEPLKWTQLTKQVMQVDFSWEKPAKEYLKIYQRLALRDRLTHA